MKKATLYLLFCCCLMACEKDEIVEVVPNPRDGLNFRIEKIINDSTIELKWDKFNVPDFRKYLLVRIATQFNKGRLETISVPIDSSTDINHTSFTEAKMPFARDINYYLYVVRDAVGSRPVSAGVAYLRPDTWLQALPTDVLIDRQRKWLYVTELQRVSILDYSTGKIVLSKEFSLPIGYCSLGDFNGAQELYVPFSDGWLQIHDAVTLEMKDRIYVAGLAIASVAAVKQKLFVGSSDRSAGGYSNCVKVYDRATKNLVGRTGYWERTRLIPLETTGNTIELVDIVANPGASGIHYYEFSAEGVPLVKREDDFGYSYRIDGTIIRSFPDGQHLITSGYGTVLDKSLAFDRYLKENANYGDFAFNESGSLIYAASAYERKIDVITYPGTTNIRQIYTSFYPYKLFRDGNVLIVVGRHVANQQNVHLFIEKFDL